MNRRRAEQNLGRLVAETGDPQVAEFMRNLDRVNGRASAPPASSG